MAKNIKNDKSSEYQKTTTSIKEVYYFKDPEHKVEQISREVFLHEDKIIHYPTPFRGKDKYLNIKKFTYIGFENKLPVGVYKVYTFGYGFTKTLRPVIEHLNKLAIKEVVIEKGGAVGMDLKKGILYLSEAPLAELNTAFSSLFDKQKSERERAAQQFLHKYFPTEIAEPIKNYTAGSLAAALGDWGNAMSEFSEADKQAIKDLFDKLTLLPQFFSATNLSKTKEIIDNKFIQASLAEFDKVIAIKTETTGLEKKWQKFLKHHSWIFSTLFAQPVIMYKDEAYVGGKTINNDNGKYNDFLIQGGLSNNVSFVEIKTHLTTLLEKTPYRGNDVFSTTKELSGCIAQVMNQRDHFQKTYYSLMQGSNDVQTFNSRALVIIGHHDSLTQKQKGAFELFRTNNKDVEIITFDELRVKMASLLSIVTGKATLKKSV